MTPVLCFLHDYKVYEGADCIVQFMSSLELAAREIYDWTSDSNNINLPMVYPPHFDTIKKYSHFCSLCKEQFKKESDKFADHDHLTGAFRFIVCKTCNDKLRIERCQLPVVMHNYKNYDSHVLCIEGFSQMQDWDFSVIAQTSERYIMTTASFPLTKYKCIGDDGEEREKTLKFKIRFLDSCQFLQTSLQSLVEKLHHDKFYQLQAGFGDHDWLYRKGVFPYSWFDSWEKYNATPSHLRTLFMMH